MATWLGLEAEDTGWTLTDSGGMRRILKNMDHASGCYPSLPLFIGQTTKVQALRSLYPYNNIRRYAKRNLARVYLSGRTGSYPVVLMEASLSGRGIKVRSPPPKQVEGVHRYRIHNSHNVSYGDIENLVYLRCLVPVCDVLCLFVADLGGIAHVQDILRSWGSSPLLSLDGSRRSRPRLLIVLTDPQDKLNEVDDMERTLTNTVVPNLAASVTTVDLRNRNQLSSVSRYEPLQRQLTLELDEARAARSKARLLFSAPHLDWILRRLFRCVAQRPTSPFNCIIACRERRDSWGIADNTTQYLTEFLDITNQAGVPVIPVVDFIASAFLMDAYPPGMHEFDPVIMFRSLYADHCVAACLHSQASPLARSSSFAQEIEGVFVTMFSTISSTMGSAEVRRELLEREATIWATVKSNHVCLFCLRRPPEHVLPCGHSMCDICVRIFGQRGRGAEYHAKVTSCPACLQNFSLTIRLLPPTKRPTVLVLDGGGIRGVVTLGFLKALEDEIGGSRGLHEAFDLTLGTSAGALIASEVIVRGTRTDVASTKFKNLSRQIFSSRPRRQTLLGQSWDLLTTLVTDSRYNTRALDCALQETFGSSRRLFDTTAPMVAGIRVALTASHVEDGLLSLFANYRAVRRPGMQSAYKLLVSNEREPLLWEVARCSVAALGYFTPKSLPGLGTLQDGGVRANCPLRTALRESEIIWPASQGPDLVISIGTGYAVDGPADGAARQPRFPRDSFIERGIRTFLTSPAVDGQRGWRDALDSIPKNIRKNVFRLDCGIAGKLPELDDTLEIDKLGEFEYRIPAELSRAWLARTFFFELDTEPVMLHGSYDCQGSILCCKFDAAGLIEQVKLAFPDARFTLAEGHTFGSVEGDSGCTTCGYYRKRILFRVSSIHESVELGIYGTTGFSSLGGFPTTVQDLLEAQQADFPFGRADHRSDQWPPLRQCYCTRRKRSRESARDESMSKKRRL
ncbi:acyl transferase/acyl hydrolase/lysophospholipase [Aspergillus flavus]|uniref:Acyl transferase/acyl hydrolase/lysophospholipase n=1 Tax=Aspergillus flavus TaxID=5059 RepID=A0A5N6GQC2_ASPFL|nr:acyl transferase/acyl hydrolase/lysophospholipase [Aspergillus flavus]